MAQKSPPEVIALFESLHPAGDDVERREMFGSPGYFVNGNMAVGLHEENFVLRLPEAERGRFVKLTGGRPFEPSPGRVMREYVVTSKALRQTPQALAKWVDMAVAYARSVQQRPSKPALAAPDRPRRGGRPTPKPHNRRPGKLTVEIKPPRRTPPKG
jgi:TfoX/Sxy family transcriptional regulator of competence genes